MNLKKPDIIPDDFPPVVEVSASTPSKAENPTASATGGFSDSALADALEIKEYSYPLSNPKYESFVRAIFGGATQVDAYLECVSTSAKKSTAKTESRRLLKRPEVATRLDYLKTSVEGLKQPITRLEAIRCCTEIMRSPNASPDNKLKALDRLAKMFKWFDVKVDDPARKRPDPAFMTEFIKRSQANLTSLEG